MKYAPPDIIPWYEIQGQPVHTNGVIEEALGLPIVGWCKEGFYTREKEALQKRMAEIDWARVQLVNSEFGIRMGRGDGMVLTSEPVTFVTERRFQILITLCFKSVPDCEFIAACAKAKLGKRPRYQSGGL